MIARLHEIIEQQEQRIEHLLERLAQLEPPAQPQLQRPARQPAVY
jgi:hypothetical protein